MLFDTGKMTKDTGTDQILTGYEVDKPLKNDI